MDHSIAHAFVYGKVRQKTRGTVVDRKKAVELIRFIVRIPSHHQTEFFNEMVSAGFFRKISRDKYEILSKKNIKQTKDYYGNPLFKI